MNYILMHRKIPVAEIEIDMETATVSKIGKIFAPERVPVGIEIDNAEIGRGSLNKWWKGRAIPASRKNINEALENLGVSSPTELLTKCFGLSLSDQYWANPMDNILNWESINFFQNPFSEDVGNALFGEVEQHGELNLVSPDNTSDGVLKKKWKIIDGKRYLIKGGKSPFYQEPLNEICASSVMERLNIPHVAYSVCLDEDLPHSMCECFITGETELVNAMSIKSTQQRQNRVSSYEHFLHCCNTFGIPKAKESIDKMLVLDYLILNEDRHARNFGAIRNAVTLEWIGIAPIFDSGTSLWHDQPQISPALDILRKVRTKCFETTHEEQIRLVKDFSWLDLSALEGIENDFSRILSLSPFIDEKRIDDICKAFNARVQSLGQHVHSLQPKKIAVHNPYLR